MSAITAVPITMRRMESVSAAFRPERSAYVPSRTAPTGRATYDNPKEPKANSNDTTGFELGKKTTAMVGAK